MLQSKIDDFVRWASLAFDHFENKRYPDALTNMRKSGEAACKLILINQYPKKVAEEKISNKTFSDFIWLLTREGLISRKTVNSLETLQIYGNTGTHDNEVVEEQAKYAIQSLNILSKWIFEECLKIAVPSSLQKHLSKETQIHKERAEKEYFNKEILELKKQKEILENQARLTSQEKRLAEEQLHKKLESILNQVEEMKQSGQKTTLLEDELARTKKEMEEIKNPSIDKKLPKEKIIFSKRALFILVPAFIICIVLFISIRFFSSNVATSQSTAITTSSPDTISILILPFTVLQDNPNVAIKFEENLKRKIMEQVTSTKIKMPIRIIFERQRYQSPQTFDEAFTAGEKESALLVIYGDIYELNEGAQVNARWFIVDKINPRKGETGIKSFMNLSDSKADTIQQEITCMVSFGITLVLMAHQKYSDALAVLYQTIPISESEKREYYDLIASCHYWLGNYEGAKKEIEKYISLFPHEEYGWGFMANIFKRQQRYDSAQRYYEKALSIDPAKINTLINYADLLVLPYMQNYDYAKRLYLRALKYDSVNTVALQLLGDLCSYQKNFSEAEIYYRKSLKYGPDNIISKKNLASIVALQFHRAKEGIELIESVLKSDSTDPQALFILASIYATELKNAEKADYYFKKSKQYNKLEEAGNYEGLGIAAFQKNDYKTAEKNYLKAYSMDSNNYGLCNYMAHLYLNMKNFPSAKKYLFRAQEIDSLNWLTNFNLGYFYAESDPQNKDFKKAEYYFEKVLQTNPYDIRSMQYLSSMKYMNGNIQDAKKIALRLVELDPNNYAGNKLLGYLFMNNEANYEKAKPYLERTLSIPTEFEAYSYLAVCIMKLSKNSEIQKALQYAKRAIEIQPNCAECQYRLAEIYTHANNFIKAKEHYDIAVSLNPALKNAGMEKSFTLN